MLLATGLRRTPLLFCKPDEPRRLTLSRTTRVKARLNSFQLTPKKPLMCFWSHNNDRSNLGGMFLERHSKNRVNTRGVYLGGQRLRKRSCKLAKQYT